MSLNAPSGGAERPKEEIRWDDLRAYLGHLLQKNPQTTSQLLLSIDRLANDGHFTPEGFAAILAEIDKCKPEVGVVKLHQEVWATVRNIVILFRHFARGKTLDDFKDPVIRQACEGVYRFYTDWLATRHAAPVAAAEPPPPMSESNSPEASGSDAGDSKDVTPVAEKYRFPEEKIEKFIPLFQRDFPLDAKPMKTLRQPFSKEELIDHYHSWILAIRELNCDGQRKQEYALGLNELFEGSGITLRTPEYIISSSPLPANKARITRMAGLKQAGRTMWKSFLEKIGIKTAASVTAGAITATSQSSPSATSEPNNAAKSPESYWKYYSPVMPGFNFYPVASAPAKASLHAPEKHGKHTHVMNLKSPAAQKVSLSAYHRMQQLLGGGAAGMFTLATLGLGPVTPVKAQEHVPSAPAPHSEKADAHGHAKAEVKTEAKVDKEHHEKPKEKADAGHH